MRGSAFAQTVIHDSYDAESGSGQSSFGMGVSEQDGSARQKTSENDKGVFGSMLDTIKMGLRGSAAIKTDEKIENVMQQGQ